MIPQNKLNAHSGGLFRLVLYFITYLFLLALLFSPQLIFYKSSIAQNQLNKNVQLLDASQSIGAQPDKEKSNSIRFTIQSNNHELEIEKLHLAVIQDAADTIRTVAESLFAEGAKLDKKGDVESLKIAKQKYSKALLLWQNIDNYEMIIATLHRLGEVCFKVSDYQGMQLYYYRALRQSREHKDINGEATALHKIGVAQMSKNEAFEALDNLEEALKLSQQLKNQKLEADILDTFGQIYTEFDDYEKGVEYAQRSLVIRKTLGDEEKIAASLQTLAQAYENIGENQKALDYYHEALEIFHKIGPRNAEALALGQIGFIYYKFGQQEQAIDYYQQCLNISEEIGYRHGQAWALKIMGDIYRQKGDNELALHNYKVSLDICRQIGVRIGVAANMSNLAMVYINMDSTEKALEILDESLVIHREINDREGGANVLNKIGELYGGVGDINKAIDYHQQALAIAQTIQDPRLFQRTYFALGRQERRAGRTEIAREHIEKSVQLADSLRRSVLSQNMRASYFASIHDCYDELMLLFMLKHTQQPNSGCDYMAFQISEKSRCQSLLEMLNEGQVDLRAGVDPGLLERERLVRQKLNAKELQRQRMTKDDPDNEKLNTLENEIRTLLTKYENIETRIRQKQPRLAAIEKTDALPLEKIQTDILDDSTMLIEYALIDEHSFAWAITSENIECVELPPVLDIEERARLVYQYLTARNASIKEDSASHRLDRIQSSDEQLYTAMSDLSNMILSPLVKYLKKPRLVFVCDEILQFIPLSVLPMPDVQKKSKKTYDLLVNHFQVLSVPSASALALIREEKARVLRPEKQVAVFADPVFSSDDPRFAPAVKVHQDSSNLIAYDKLDKTLMESGIGTRSDLSRLPFSRKEANDIISLAGSENCKCFMDFDANYSQAISPDLSNFNIIHFATHGLLNTMHPELSGLVLSLYDEQGKPQNGFLRLHDIYQLNLNADLVVLSACQTALGKDIRGEGLIGLTRGFMYAGAPRVIASLWKVDDEATAELMKIFYQYMLGGDQLPAVEALRKAQISIMNEKRWQSPYYWAGFILQGDWK